MADPQYLSTDPSWGAPVAEPHVGTPSAKAPVTLGDLLDNPTEAAKRMGSLLKADLTDPKTWQAVAASLSAGFLLPAIAPGMAAGAKGFAGSVVRAGGKVADSVNPDLVSIASPRTGAALKLAQKARDTFAESKAIPKTEAPAPAAPVSEPAAAPPSLGQAMQVLQAQAPKAGVKLTASEVSQGLKWVKQGVSADEVMRRILQSRELTQKLKLPTPDVVRRAVTDRNTTGEWE